ncbi:MAG: hypothetical protein QGH29_08105 [Kiritimatiellia bacterium]|nr:hypothetical protein [Kiritimatiellia bacterium]
MPVWLSIAMAYLTVGLLIILVIPRVRREVVGSFKDVGLDRTPLWATCLFGCLISIAILLLWPLFLPSWLRKKESIMDELQRDPKFKQQKLLFDAMQEMSANGCDTDEIPGGHGEFGHDLSNPIPVKTIFGSMAYLARLQTADGDEIEYQRIGSCSSPVSDNPVDSYAISDMHGDQLGTLYLSPYHKRNSAKTPKGFAFVSLS